MKFEIKKDDDISFYLIYSYSIYSNCALFETYLINNYEI